MITYKNYEITQQQIQAHMESALCWANMWLGLKGCSVSSKVPLQMGLVLKIFENALSLTFQP